MIFIVDLNLDLNRFKSSILITWFKSNQPCFFSVRSRNTMQNNVFKLEASACVLNAGCTWSWVERHRTVAAASLTRCTVGTVENELKSEFLLYWRRVILKSCILTPAVVWRLVQHTGESGAFCTACRSTHCPLTGHSNSSCSSLVGLVWVKAKPLYLRHVIIIFQ